MRKNKPPLFKDFFGTIRQDFKDVNLPTSFRRDLRAIYEFYLSQHERQQLANMGWFRRWLYRIFWFIKSIFLKLTPFRRILLFISLILLVGTQDTSRLTVGYAIIFIVLLLELKDKLLAHDELSAGRAVQAALRPDQCPKISGWDAFMFSQSANEVGGDVVDCLELEEDRFAFLVGDVAGKGLGAALLSAQLQASVHALAPTIKSPNKLVAQLNQLSCRGGLSSRFISFIYLEIKADAGKITFVNAGHMPPFLLGGENVEELQKGGVALGLDAKAKYKDQIVTVNSGDVFIVYTDGLTEARNPGGEFFGEAQLQHLLSSLSHLDCAEMGRRILEHIKKYMGDAPRNDDLTFLILKRKNGS